jgi:signal transduction histidine kinase
VYLIFKEALHNIVKHAQATHVAIRIESNSGNLTMRIADNGIGIEETNGSRGNGLRSMRKRAADIQADLSIENTNGTTIRLTRVNLT